METNPERVTKAFLTAVRQGDYGQLVALLHPEVIWLQPGSNRLSGEKRSSAEVFQMAGNMAETANHALPLTETKAMAVNGNRVACLIHWQATMPIGKVLAVDNIDVYAIENGSIVRVEVYSADIRQRTLSGAERHFPAGVKE
jgi:ketosteroid isomerase-like protein